MKMVKGKFTASLALRLGIAFVFLYAAFSTITNPLAWVGFVPDFVEILMSKETFLYVHDTVNILLAVWLLSGKKVFYAAVVSSIAFAGIILGNLGSMIIVFRDIGLLMAAIALALIEKDKA